jgi:hypothetical protein
VEPQNATAEECEAQINSTLQSISHLQAQLVIMKRVLRTAAPPPNVVAGKT